jgi:HK97 family phage major capsid protein
MNPERRALLLKGERTERRDMVVGTVAGGAGGAYPGSAGGFFAPLDFSGKVESALKVTAAILGVCSFWDTATGAPAGYPMDNDTSVVGEQVAENAQVTGSADVANLTLANYSSFKFGSKLVKVTNELLQDTGFDLEAYLAERFAWRIGRVMSPLLVTGSGSGTIKGVLTGIQIGVGPSTTPAVQGNDNLTTPNPQNQVGYLDLVNLEASLDPLYRVGAVWMMHNNTLSYIKALKDLNGRPLYLYSADGGPYGSILGYPVYPNPDFPQLAAGNITVAFGRFDRYMVRRGPMSVRRLSERYADYGQTAFLCFARRDGQLLNAGNPIVALQQHS